MEPHLSDIDGTGLWPDMSSICVHTYMYNIHVHHCRYSTYVYIYTGLHLGGGIVPLLNLLHCIRTSFPPTFWKLSVCPPSHIFCMQHWYTIYGRRQKKFPSPVRTTGPFPFRSRLISMRLLFLSVFKPFPFCPTGSPSVLVNGLYGVIKHAQSLIAVISAGRLATVQ